MEDEGKQLKRRTPSSLRPDAGEAPPADPLLGTVAAPRSGSSATGLLVKIGIPVVVAIIGVLALLGLRMYTGQQDKAKNAIVKANSATIHTIIQGNLADSTYASAELAVNSIKKADGTYVSGGQATNLELPAGMKNPHATGDTDLVVLDSATPGATIAAGAGTKGQVVVQMDNSIANKFYIIGFDQDGGLLGEQYTAQK